jgi:branched-subunit amino acid transport protein AzlD
LVQDVRHKAAVAIHEIDFSLTTSEMKLAVSLFGVLTCQCVSADRVANVLHHLGEQLVQYVSMEAETMKARTAALSVGIADDDEDDEHIQSLALDG